MKLHRALALSALLMLLFAPIEVIAADNENINKTLASEVGISEEQAARQIQQVFEAIESELIAGRSVLIRRFGKFHVHKRSARQGRNPRTGETINIPARKYPRFSSSAVLKRQVNGD